MNFSVLLQCADKKTAKKNISCYQTVNRYNLQPLFKLQNFDSLI